MLDTTRKQEARPDRNPRGVIDLYLSEISRLPVLEPAELEAIAAELVERTRDFRRRMLEMPGTAELLVARWRELRGAGRNTAVLSDRYRDGTGADAAGLIDGGLERAAVLLGAERRDGRAIAAALDGAQVALPELESCYRQLARLDRRMGRRPRSTAERRRATALTGLPKAEFVARFSELRAAREDLYATKDRFITRNLRLVAKISRRFLGMGVSLEDLIQEANIGLIRAVEKFDHTLGYRFSTYAIWWIQQALIRAVQRHGRDVRIPSHIHQRIVEVGRTEGELELRLHRAPTSEELARELSLPLGKVEQVLDARRRPVSMERPQNESESLTLGDVLPDEELADPVDRIDSEARCALATRLLDGLDPRSREVVAARFGLGDQSVETLQAIGERLGVSRERVRQIEQAALETLRNLEGAPL